jgi:hypothetical protein
MTRAERFGLNWANKFRTLIGLPTLAEIPCGVKGNPFSCPLANATGNVIEIDSDIEIEVEAYGKTQAEAIKNLKETPTFRYAKALKQSGGTGKLDTVIRSRYNDRIKEWEAWVYTTLKPPAAVSSFIRSFDGGDLPHLDEDAA